jgi:hypothetical protein
LQENDMNCANAICSFGDADWYLDFTGWRGLADLALIAVALAVLVGARWARR